MHVVPVRGFDGIKYVELPLGDKMGKYPDFKTFSS
jgi:hypothetical protein